MSIDTAKITNDPSNSPQDISKDDSNFPATEQIAELRDQIDDLDRQIIHLIQERTRISRKIGGIRQKHGGPRVVQSREEHIIDQFTQVGQEGKDIANILLRLGRGPLPDSTTG